MAAQARSERPKPTVAHEWVFVAVISALLMGTTLAHYVCSPMDFGLRSTDYFFWASLAVFVLSHGVWICMDCIRRGKPVIGWTLAGFLTTWLAVLIYLIVEYRLRGLMCFVLVYGLNLAVPAVVYRLAM